MCLRSKEHIQPSQQTAVQLRFLILYGKVGKNLIGYRHHGSRPLQKLQDGTKNPFLGLRKRFLSGPVDSSFRPVTLIGEQIG